MREYGQVQCSYWRHPEIRALRPPAREFGVYLLTGPHSNGIGCYFLPDGYVIADLGWSVETISEGFAQLSAIGFATRCELTSFLLIPEFLKWNEIANPNVALARIKEFETVPKKARIYEYLCSCLKQYGKHWPTKFEKVLVEVLKQEPTLPNPTQKEPEILSPPPKPGAAEQKPKKVWGTEEDHALAHRMFDAIKVVAPSAKEPSWDAWANAIRLMREQDERTHEQIWAQFDWANRDSFWRVNVLSPGTLRDRWNQLEAKRLNSPRPTATTKVTDYGTGGRI